MQLSYNWLKQFIPLRIKPEKLAEILNLHVASVEKIVKLEESLDKVLVGKIIEIKPHPRADRLQIAIIKTAVNKKIAIFQVVCGGPNIKIGQKVPLALPGAKLSNNLILKSSRIRGIKSEAMLCAEDELGIGDDHDGIYILKDQTKLGQPITKVLGLNDVILEIENKSITHRPDLFSHLGFAREIGALTKNNLKFKIPNLKFKISKPKKLEIKVDNNKLCPRYMGVVMDNIKVGPSPKWMRSLLQGVGIRPINNIVDITNYVMMELGQPLHAFDAETLMVNNQRLIIKVRSAKKNEKLLALDGEEYKLNKDDLVIADAQKPIALAGVMGGELSSISDTTNTIIIESANFNPVSVRKTSRRLGLRTDSALRFEKGLPVSFTELGLARAIELIKKLAGGKISSQVVDFKSKQTINQLRQAIRINFDFTQARRFIGLDLTDREMIAILKSLGCQIKKVGQKVMVTIPNYRLDLNLFEDLIEEIIRIYGSDKINPQPILGKLEPVLPRAEFVLENKLKNILTGAGFDEVYNYSFYGKELKENSLNQSKHLSLANPLNPEQQYLRTSLIPGLLKNTEKNVPYFPEFKIFEIGQVFLPEETKKIAGLIFSQDKDIYFLVKGVVELIFNLVGLDQKKIRYQVGNLNMTNILLDKNVFGLFGLKEKGIGVFEIDFASLLKFAQKVKIYSKISTYPTIKRDLAFLIDKNISWYKIWQTLDQIKSLNKDVTINIKKEPLDVFEDKKFGQQRNIAFSVIYQSFKRTLKSEEIKKDENQIIDILEKKFKAQLRDF